MTKCKHLIDISPFDPLCDHPCRMNGGGAVTAHCDGCSYYAEDIKAQNAKLLKLVRWMYERMDESCAVHYPYAPEPISYRHLMRAEELMRELGIEPIHG